MLGYFAVCSDSDGWTTCFFHIVLLWSLFYTVVLGYAYFRTNALYLLLLVIAGAWDTWVVNFVLRYLIGQKGPHPTINHHAYEMPSAHTQFLLFVATMIILLHLIYKVEFSVLFVVTTFSFAMATLYAPIYFRYNTSAQLIVGAFVGILDGIFVNLVIAWMIYPVRQKILDHWISRFWNLTDEYFVEYEIHEDDDKERIDSLRVKQALNCRTLQDAIHRMSKLVEWDFERTHRGKFGRSVQVQVIQ